jgi:phosphoglycolate phosphatase
LRRSLGTIGSLSSATVSRDISAFLDYHKLHKYFCDFECAGDTGLSKGENLALVISRNGFRAPVFIGDTQGDANAAKAAGIPFIFARYGFGSAPDALWGVDGVKDLLEMF